MAKPKPIHADDIALAREIARSTEFSAFFRKGPLEKFHERGFPTYEAAQARVDEWVAEFSKFGRGGMVYAINNLGSFPVDAKMLAIVASLGEA